MNKRTYLILVALLILPLLLTNSPTQISAQGNQPRNCPQLVRVAEEELVLNCVNLPGNMACYGYPEVEARLEADPAHPVDTEFVPGSWAALHNYVSFDAAAMNVDEAIWGLGALNVVANVPRGLVEELPVDPGVLFLLFGEATVENAVPDGMLYIPVDEPLPVTVASDTMVMAEPAATSEELGTALADSTLFADGVSPDGEWVRVAFDMQAGWVMLDDLVAVDVSGLPEIGPDSLTPMQSFYLRTGSGAPQCNQAMPAGLFMQTPRDVEADLILDGVPLELTSATVFARILPGNILKFQVVSGFMTLYPDTVNEVIIPAGFSYTACELTPPDQIDGWDDDPNDQVADCVGGLPVPFTNAERQEIQAIEGLPDNLFRYEFRVPRVTRGSGVGGPIDRVIIDPDSPAYDEIIRNCDLGRIPPEVCQHLAGYTPGG
ncbi:MAG: hypothetical protein Kow0077_25210 [Anaerolineae bacterium]